MVSSSKQNNQTQYHRSALSLLLFKQPARWMGCLPSTGVSGSQETLQLPCSNGRIMITISTLGHISVRAILLLSGERHARQKYTCLVRTNRQNWWEEGKGGNYGVQNSTGGISIPSFAWVENRRLSISRTYVKLKFTSLDMNLRLSDAITEFALRK